MHRLWTDTGVLSICVGRLSDSIVVSRVAGAVSEFHLIQNQGRKEIRTKP